MDNRVLEHLQVLFDRVFQVDKLWPQFRLLLNDLTELAGNIPPDSVVVSLERSLLYGGCSLIAPLFSDVKFTAIDCSPRSADDRGAYNAHLVDDPRFLSVPITRRATLPETGVADGEADLVIVPNLVHHVCDQDGLFRELSRIVKPGGRVYVFEALVREIHQAPDDFLRYTPYGLEAAFRRVGLQSEPVRTEGGPFQVITYCWIQALQYLKGEDKQRYTDWFFRQHFQELLQLDSLNANNLEKPHSSFPMSFSVIARKPSVPNVQRS